jgi:hypothetical protein
MIDFEAMAQIWREQDANSSLRNEAELLERLQDDFRYRNRKLLWLSLREGVPCLFLAALTLTVGLTTQSGGWAFLTASGLFLIVAIFLIAIAIARQVSRPSDLETVRQSLQRSLAQARHSEWLYGSIAWWYLLPIMVGWGAIVYEKMFRHGMSLFAIVYVSVGLAFFFYVGWLNRRIALKHYRPLRVQLEKMLEQFVEEE